MSVNVYNAVIIETVGALDLVPANTTDLIIPVTAAIVGKTVVAFQLKYSTTPARKCYKIINFNHLNMFSYDGLSFCESNEVVYNNSLKYANVKSYKDLHNMSALSYDVPEFKIKVQPVFIDSVVELQIIYIGLQAVNDPPLEVKVIAETIPVPVLKYIYTP